MKARLFLILWMSLFLAVGLASYIYSYVLRKERLDLIDLQIRSHSLLLEQSDFLSLGIYDPIEAEDHIQDILGGYRAGLFLLVRDQDGEIVYENFNVRRLDIDPDWNDTWQTIDEGNNVIRILTTELSAQGRILQVGLLVNKGVLKAVYDIPTFYPLLLAWLLGSMFLSYFLATLLFSPLKRMAKEVGYLSYNLDVEHIEQFSKKMTQSLWPFLLQKSDEFLVLRKSLVDLLRQIGTAIRLNSAHSARLVHEINTPLTIIRTKIESIPERPSREYLNQVIEDIDRLASFARNYLLWSETTYKPLQDTQLFAIKIDSFVRNLVRDMNGISNDRVTLSGASGAKVIASRDDLEHLLQNLITNALKYSGASSEVRVLLGATSIVVADTGSGIPKSVLEHLGEPFNAGNTDREANTFGTGIGLAWVKAITQKYSWKLDIQTGEGGTSVTIVFPEEPESQNSDLA